jgi:hypothetical protein
MAMVRKRAMMPPDMSIEIHTAIICVAEAKAISRIAGAMYARYSSRVPPVMRPAPRVSPKT